MFQSRKFAITVFLTVLYTLLRVMNLIDQGTYAGLMGTLVPLYFAANVSQKVWAPVATETQRVGDVEHTTRTPLA